MKKIIKEKLNLVIALFIIIITFGISLTVMLKYKTEGETNMPIIIKRILIVSSADAENKQENPENQKWNLSINQYNDIYINFEKNENYKKNTYINSISMENINITNPKVGELKLYMPSNSENKVFTYEDQFVIKDSLTYTGALKDNIKSYEISNSGGTFLFRAVNPNVCEYISNEDDEIRYDGTLIKKSEIKTEELKASINFDIVIKTNKSTYRGNITIDVPSENVEEEGVSQLVIDDLSNIVFKRERSK